MTMNQLSRHSKLLQFAALLAVFFILCFSIDPSENNILWRLPALLAGVPKILNDSVEFLMFEWMPVEFYNAEIEEYEESALVKVITRSVSGALLFCIQLIRELLLGGVKTIVAFTSWDFIRENSWAHWPALPWTVVSGAAIILGYALNGRWLALFVAFSTIYIAIFGQWEPAMETLSFVLVAAPLSVLLGLGLGVLAYENRAVEAALMPLLNIAQTMPHFSYLVPVTVFFGDVVVVGAAGLEPANGGSKGRCLTIWRRPIELRPEGPGLAVGLSGRPRDPGPSAGPLGDPISSAPRGFLAPEDAVDAGTASAHAHRQGLVRLEFLPHLGYFGAQASGTGLEVVGQELAPTGGIQAV